jgi:hypothetical protein
VSVDLSCLSCDALHSYGERITGPALVKILTDQAFPPRLPANDVNCKVVVRLEDGILSEIVSAFLTFLTGFLSLAGALPTGSFILEERFFKEMVSKIENGYNCHQNTDQKNLVLLENIFNSFQGLFMC